VARDGDGPRRFASPRAPAARPRLPASPWPWASPHRPAIAESPRSRPFVKPPQFRHCRFAVPPPFRRAAAAMTKRRPPDMQLPLGLTGDPGPSLWFQNGGADGQQKMMLPDDSGLLHQRDIGCSTSMSLQSYPGYFSMSKQSTDTGDGSEHGQPVAHQQPPDFGQAERAGAVDRVYVEAAAMDHVVITVDAGVGAHLEHPSTRGPKSSPSIAVSCTSDTGNTNYKEHLKPMVGMIFDTLTDVEKFYKSYAHEAGFFVRVDQHKKQNEEILIKQYYCSREGYRKENIKNVSDESGKKKKDT